MSTKIFKVRFSYIEMANGKSNGRLWDTKSVVAKDALAAIVKTKKKSEKPYSFKDDETKKKITCTYKNHLFESVELVASSD